MKSKISSYIIIFGVLMILAVSCNKIDKPPAAVNDIEGNFYKTVEIDDQIWMAENLKTTRYNDGTEIQLIENEDEWRTLETSGFCWYDNNESEFKETYGALYNGYAVVTGKLCPAGWHVPDIEEWQHLITFLGDTVNAGGELKETGTAHWHSPNKYADNSSGFTALAAGLRYHEGSFSSILFYTGFWTSSETETFDQWYIGLYYGNPNVKISHRPKKFGFSVRCIKD
jgi:uncharacterized protein (TIGR02145 family)